VTTGSCLPAAHCSWRNRRRSPCWLGCRAAAARAAALQLPCSSTLAGKPQAHGCSAGGAYLRARGGPHGPSPSQAGCLLISAPVAPPLPGGSGGAGAPSSAGRHSIHTPNLVPAGAAPAHARQPGSACIHYMQAPPLGGRGMGPAAPAASRLIFDPPPPYSATPPQCATHMHCAPACRRALPPWRGAAPPSAAACPGRSAAAAHARQCGFDAPAEGLLLPPRLLGVVYHY